MYILRTYTCKTTGNTYDVNIHIINKEPLFNSMDIFKIIKNMEVCNETIDKILMSMDTTDIYQITTGYAVYGRDNTISLFTYKGLHKLLSIITNQEIHKFEDWIIETMEEIMQNESYIV